MIDFTTVAREFRGLVDRRREVFMFLGTSFAALGLFLQNSLQGGLPTSLAGLQEHVFAFYAGTLSLLSLILSLRMAKMHGGLVINGMLFAHLMTNQNFTAKGDLARSARHNFFGVSFLQFLLVNLIAYFSTLILLLSLGFILGAAAGISAGVLFLWMVLYFYFHRQAKRYAYWRIANDRAEPVKFNEWEDHISLCLQQSTQALLSEVAFAGLMVFSCFEALSGLGSIKTKTDLPDVTTRADLAYGVLMVVVCYFQLMIYIRTYVAIGGFCLKLDPKDKPFRAFRLTDSFLGYVTLAALFTVATHVLLSIVYPSVDREPWMHVGLDAAAFGFAIFMHQSAMIRYAFKMHQ